MVVLYFKCKKTRRISATGFFYLALTMFYFHMGSPHYHRRCFVSLLSSAWGQVVPKRYGHQEIWVQMFNDIVPRTSIPFAQGEPISRYR